MKKNFRNLVTLLLTTLIAALGFTSCGSQKKALEEKQRQEEAARLAEEQARSEEAQRAQEAETRRLIEEAERRRIQIERQKLVYGPPTADFREGIK